MQVNLFFDRKFFQFLGACSFKPSSLGPEFHICLIFMIFNLKSHISAQVSNTV